MVSLYIWDAASSDIIIQTRRRYLNNKSILLFSSFLIRVVLWNTCLSLIWTLQRGDAINWGQVLSWLNQKYKTWINSNRMNCWGNTNFFVCKTNNLVKVWTVNTIIFQLSPIINKPVSNPNITLFLDIRKISHIIGFQYTYLKN